MKLGSSKGRRLPLDKHELFCEHLTLCPQSEIEMEYWHGSSPSIVLPKIEYFQNGEWHRARLALANWV